MRRAERLFNLVEYLRRHRRPVTAEAMAEDMEVSLRTVYRDMQALAVNGVPVRGEAGIGYVLDPGFDLPPLMFSTDEIEAVILGMQFVAERGDPRLATSADSVIAKLTAVVPEKLKPLIADGAFFAPDFGKQQAALIDESLVRQAIREERKVHIRYTDQAGEETHRAIWPFALAYLDRVRMVAAWCELRNDIRHFRTDRILEMSELRERYPRRRTALLREWKQLTS